MSLSPSLKPCSNVFNFLDRVGRLNISFGSFGELCLPSLGLLSLCGS
jgi:hypothetical protein